MVHLILTVISIALLSAATVAGHTVVSAYSTERNATQVGAIKHLSSLEGAVARYFNDQRDENGNMLYPGDNVNLKELISPLYGFMPPQIGQMDWEVRTNPVHGMDAVSICLRPVNTEPLSKASLDSLSSMHARLPVDSAFLNDSCGATSHDPEGTHLTYWVALPHLD